MSQQEHQNETIHRVGTITLGLSLILFGILFLMHLFFPSLNYQIIFHLWPCIFILLGIEVLLGCKNKQFVLDKGAIFLLIILALFAMFMGVMNFAMNFAMEKGVREIGIYF